MSCICQEMTKNDSKLPSHPLVLVCLARKIPLLREVAKILHEFNFKPIGIDKIDVSSIGLISTVFAYGKACFG